MYSTSNYLVVLLPTVTNSSYEDIDLNVVVEYTGPLLVNSSTSLTFRYAANPDINAISPKRIWNTFVHFICVHDQSLFISLRNYMRVVCAFVIYMHTDMQQYFFVFGVLNLLGTRQKGSYVYMHICRVPECLTCRPAMNKNFMRLFICKLLSVVKFTS